MAEASSLRLLRVHHSALDDSKLMTLLSQMQGNSSLEALAFPHCRIGDEGAAALARFLSERPKLRKLDIRLSFSFLLPSFEITRDRKNTSRLRCADIHSGGFWLESCMEPNIFSVIN